MLWQILLPVLKAKWHPISCWLPHTIDLFTVTSPPYSCLLEHLLSDCVGRTRIAEITGLISIMMLSAVLRLRLSIISISAFSFEILDHLDPLSRASQIVDRASGVTDSRSSENVLWSPGQLSGDFEFVLDIIPIFNAQCYTPQNC